MAIDYQWEWLRGQKLTARFDNSATALSDTYVPIAISSNALTEPSQGQELVGVAIPDAGASESGVPVIISDDVFKVQLDTGENPDIGDAVTVEADGSVSVHSAGSGDAIVGHVVDYDPASAGICQIKADFAALKGLQATYRMGFNNSIIGDITEAPATEMVCRAPFAGTITQVGFRHETAGADTTDDLSIAMDCNIDGTTCMDTEPALAKGASDTDDTFSSGTGITVGVIDTTADDIAAGDIITVAWTLTRTTPDTEIADLSWYVEIQPTLTA
ncbi:MAG: hypothetical protein K9L56_15190 [Clostridiales bacterium]|nr:hypothetical protein [Clostridiales bacterium]